MLLGLVELVRARRLAWIPLALVVLSPLCVLATPYGWDIVAYYKLMLVDAPFAPILREWQWSSPSGTTALFWLLALVAAGILALRRCRSRLTFYELAVLVLTFAGAVQAVRGVIWFALAAAAILPVALDGLLTKADVDAPQAQPHDLARRPRRRRGRNARRSSRAPPPGSCPNGPRRASRPCARRPATRASASGRPTAPPTGSSGGSRTSAAASPTTSASSSTTSRRSSGIVRYGAAQGDWSSLDGYAS